MADTIVVQALSKRFRRYREHRAMTFEEALLHGGWRKRPVEYLWALRNVSFGIAPGRMVGIVGPNGAGKSTLLRLIGGVGRPDQGRVAVNGRIGSLLDLGVGFHPDLSGRENVFINGVIAGLTRREVARRIDAIVAFAELEEFLDSPLRTYSTGMQMRLAFAVAAHTDPEVLLVDEILAVGDLAFQRKCMDRIAQFRAEGCTILLVSHDANAIRQMCDEALWLRRGELVAYGPANVVVDQYVAEMSVETRRRTPITHPVAQATSGTELQVNQNRFGSLEMEIIAVRLCDRSGLPIAELGNGDMLCVEMDYSAPNPIHSPIFGVTISREDGTICYDTSTEAAGAVADSVEGTGTVSLTVDRLDLAGGEYYVDVGVYVHQWAYAYDYHWHVYPLTVRAPRWGKGILQPPSHWRLER